MNKFAEQFNNDVIARYQQKLAALSKQASFRDDFQGVGSIIANAMIPQTLKDVDTILKANGSVGLSNTRTRDLSPYSIPPRSTKDPYIGTALDIDGKPFMYNFDTQNPDKDESVSFLGDHDSYTNSKYY